MYSRATRVRTYTCVQRAAVGCACPPTQRPRCATPSQRDSELLERHVTISWPKGYSRAQASLRRIAVLHCCRCWCVVLIQPIAVPPCRCSTSQPGGVGVGAIFSAGVGGGRTREQKDRRGQKTRRTQAGRTHGRQARTWLANCVVPCPPSPLPSDLPKRPRTFLRLPLPRVLPLAHATRPLAHATRTSACCACHAFFCHAFFRLPRVLRLPGPRVLPRPPGLQVPTIWLSDFSNKFQ